MPLCGLETANRLRPGEPLSVHGCQLYDNAHLFFRTVAVRSDCVKTLIEISPEYYDRLLSKIPETSVAYSVLKNGVVIHHPAEGTEHRTIDTVCEESLAKLLHVADELCPEAAIEIRKRN
jgi:hypothetical protein